MKYTITILSILLLTSCKKDYTCKCIDKDGHELYTNTYKVAKKDKSTVENDCKAEVTTLNVQNPTKTPISCALQ